MLSTISPSVTALAVGPPAQRAIAQRFSALAHSCRLAALHQVGSYLGYTGHQINIASRQTWPMRSIQSRLARPNSDIR